MIPLYRDPAKDKLSLAVAITLVHVDLDDNESGRTETFGTVARLPVSAEDLNAPSGLNGWTDTPENADRVTGLIVTHPRTGVQDSYTVLSEEPTSGALYSQAGRQTTRYALRVA